MSESVSEIMYFFEELMLMNIEETFPIST